MNVGSWWRDLSISKKLYLVVGTMAVLIVCELLTLRFAMHTLSAARAFVGGEGLWSKAQKNATISLELYGRTGDEKHFVAFLRYLKIPDGDHQARVELLRPRPNLQKVRDGFKRGGIHPGDIDAMVDLLRRFYWTPYLSRAISVWKEGDEFISQFRKAGLAYHDAVARHDSTSMDALLDKINVLNGRLTAVEGAFSDAVGQGSRHLEYLVLSLLLVAVLIVEAVGLSMAFLLSRSISRGLGTLNDVAIHIGKGDFSKTARTDSNDEIGRLAHSVNHMGQMLKRSYSELEARVNERTLELAHSRDQLDIILQGITDGVTVIDDRGQFLYVNAAGANMCGAPSVEEFLKNPQSAYFDRIDVRDELGAPLSPEKLPSRRAFQGVRDPVEKIVRFQLKNTREERWAIVKSVAVFDPTRESKVVVTIFKDFTEHKRAQDAVTFLDEASTLLTSSLDYESTLDSLARLLVPKFAELCRIDLFDDGSLKRVASAHGKDTPFNASEGQLAWLLQPTDLSETASAQLSAFLHAGRTVFLEDHPPLLPSSDQSTSATRLLRSALLIPLSTRGRVLGGLTLAWSEVGPRESDEVRMLEELCRRASIAVDNARLYRDSQEAIRVRDDFLATAGHELRTPLTALLMHVQSVERAARKNGDTRFAERLEKAIRSGWRLEGLVNQLLDLSRITAGRLQLEPEPLDLGELVQEVVSRVVDDAARAKGTVTVHAQKDTRGSWDRMRIDQVVTNLLANALKYGQGNPVEVSVESEEDRAVLRVVDHGIGIEPAHQRRIFERFERAVDTHAYQGFGLGLWITKQIVEASGGTIEVVSTPNQGSEFTVKLPFVAEEQFHAVTTTN